VLDEKVLGINGTPIPVIIMANKSDMATQALDRDFLDKFCSENRIAAWCV
jgi:hypothetical protein